MKNLCFCLFVVFILGACKMIDEPNSHFIETQDVQITEETPGVTPEPTGTPIPIEIRPSGTATSKSVVEMTVYSDEELGIQISYPAHWSEESEGVFRGSDGYIIIKKLDNYHSPNMAYVSVDFANTHYPGFGIACFGDGGYGCAIYEGRFPETERIIQIIPYQMSLESAGYFTVKTNRQFYLQIMDSLILKDDAFEPTPTRYPTPFPSPIELNLDGITLVEVSSLDDQRIDEIEPRLVEIRGRNCGSTNKTYHFSLESSYGKMEVKENGQTIFHFSSWGMVTGPPWTFCQWDGSWILETHEVVVINGSILNHEMGHTEIFGWHLLRGRPAYFIKTGNTYSISIDGQLLPVEYEEIMHYMCCAWHASNPKTNGENTWFTAKRNGVWYKVLISVQ